MFKKLLIPMSAVLATLVIAGCTPSTPSVEPQADLEEAMKKLIYNSNIVDPGVIGGFDLFDEIKTSAGTVYDVTYKAIADDENIDDIANYMVIEDDNTRCEITPFDLTDLDYEYVVAKLEATFHLDGKTLTDNVKTFKVRINGLINPITVEEARANDGTDFTHVGKEMTLKGIVTGESGNSLFFQEDGFGMYIYNASNSADVGDEILVTGKLATYGGNPQLTGASVAVTAEDVGLPTPTVIDGAGYTDFDHLNKGQTYVSMDLTVSEVFEFADEATSVSYKAKAGDTEVTLRSDKYTIDTQWKALADSLSVLAVDDEFTIHAPMSAYNGSSQLALVGGVVITAK